MTTTLPSTFKLPGHQVLAAAGKRFCDPVAGHKQLFQWADFQPGETVLELAASFGISAIALAKRFGVRVVGVERNPTVWLVLAPISRRQVWWGRGAAGDIFNLETIWSSSTTS